MVAPHVKPIPESEDDEEFEDESPAKTVHPKDYRTSVFNMISEMVRLGVYRPYHLKEILDAVVQGYALGCGVTCETAVATEISNTFLEEIEEPVTRLSARARSFLPNFNDVATELAEYVETDLNTYLKPAIGYQFLEDPVQPRSRKPSTASSKVKPPVKNPVVSETTTPAKRPTRDLTPPDASPTADRRKLPRTMMSGLSPIGSSPPTQGQTPSDNRTKAATTAATPTPAVSETSAGKAASQDPGSGTETTPTRTGKRTRGRSRGRATK